MIQVSPTMLVGNLAGVSELWNLQDHRIFPHLGEIFPFLSKGSTFEKQCFLTNFGMPTL